MKSAAPPPTCGDASGCDRLAMDRYAALISRTVAVSVTRSTSYRPVGASRPRPTVEAAATVARAPRETTGFTGREDIPAKVTSTVDMGEEIQRDELKQRRI